MSVKKPSLTVGIEEEYQIIDPETRELKSFITHFLDGDEGGVLRRLEFRPELLQSTIEVGTTPCDTIQAARVELIDLRRQIAESAQRKGARIAAAGTHPFSVWESQDITPYQRYEDTVEAMQHLARQLLIFGMHVHIGIEDREFAVDCMNTLRYMGPHLLALSSSSPFWEGKDTGLKSFRTAMFKRLPRTGTPSLFSSYAEYQNLLEALVHSKAITDASKIFWDMRLHHKYPTLELRITDLCTNVDDAICCAAIFQALILKHYKMRMDNISFRTYPTSLIEENKWLASRYGIEGSLIDFGKKQQISMSQLIHELVEFVDDVVDDLGTRKEVEHAFTILERGTSAMQQLRIYQETQDMHAVVDWLCEETARSSALQES